MKVFDCSVIVDLPQIEIEAKSAEEAKRIYTEAVKRFIEEGDAILAIEVDVEEKAA